VTGIERAAPSQLSRGLWNNHIKLSGPALPLNGSDVAMWDILRAR